MKYKWQIPYPIKTIAVLALVFILIAFSHERQSKTVCNKIMVNLDNVYQNHFLNKSDIIDILYSEEGAIVGRILSKINLEVLEERLESHPYISQAEIYSTLKGSLMVGVTLRNPVARIIRPSMPDVYITNDGTIAPISSKFSARVVLLSGPIISFLENIDNVNEITMGMKLMEMIDYIETHDFWKAQVAQIEFDKDQNMYIYPQITSQRVEFGKLVDIVAKFKKLMIFYKEILPQVGWMKYDKVNVEYEGQIIAE